VKVGGRGTRGYSRHTLLGTGEHKTEGLCNVSLLLRAPDTTCSPQGEGMGMSRFARAAA
jgi:hypothetical protein